MLRVVYEVAKYNIYGKLEGRRFAANKKTAKKIAKEMGTELIIWHSAKDAWVDPKEVERL